MTDVRFRVAMTHLHTCDYVLAHQALKVAGFVTCPFCDGKFLASIYAIGDYKK